MFGFFSDRNGSIYPIINSRLLWYLLRLNGDRVLMVAKLAHPYQVWRETAALQQRVHIKEGLTLVALQGEVGGHLGVVLQADHGHAEHVGVHLLLVLGGERGYEVG